jgi:hypothetical protein
LLCCEIINYNGERREEKRREREREREGKEKKGLI